MYNQTLLRGGSRIWGRGGGGAAATASAAGAKVFGGSRLKTLFGISKGGGAPPAPPESTSVAGSFIHVFRVLIYVLSCERTSCGNQTAAYLQGFVGDMIMCACHNIRAEMSQTGAV